MCGEGFQNRSVKPDDWVDPIFIFGQSENEPADIVVASKENHVPDR
jgi:hypothetical protein